MAVESWRDGYASLRLLALGRPLSEEEQLGEAAAALALGSCLGIAAEEAHIQARRCVLFRREILLHEVLLVEMKPEFLAQALDSMPSARTPFPLETTGDQAGTVFLSLHYSAYSSLLWLWLARAAARGHIRRLNVLFDSGEEGRWSLPRQRRLDELAEAGILSQGTMTFLDRGVLGASGVARLLARRLREGESAVLLFDGALASPEARQASGKRTVQVAIGSRSLSFPGGVAWLAEATACRVAPVFVRPEGDGHAIVFGSTASVADSGRAWDAAAGAVQALIDLSIGVDPGPWEGWLRLPWSSG